MMDIAISVTDPAILFPGISLLFLSYTNRYLALAAIVRSLTDPENKIARQSRTAQIQNLKLRIVLIKYMQASGIVAFIFCLMSIFALLLHAQTVGEWLFVGSLVAMFISLILALSEILNSGVVLKLELSRFESDDQN
ncbi:MAG: DUF2721 domain-containing protein [Pseudomonadota bacterium]